MVLAETIIGKFINMRSVEERDADYILKLRLDENNSQFISATENNLEKQIGWIRQQRERINDYYFMFTDKENNNLGVISIYNIQDAKAESGRFISFGNSLQNMEAILIHFDFAFYDLGVDLIHFNVYKHNSKIVNMWKKLGSQIIREEKVNNLDSYYFELTKYTYERVLKPKVFNVIEKIKDN